MATSCLIIEHNDDDPVPTNGHPGTEDGSAGSGSDARLLALVMPTPRDHNLEYMVGISSMAVVIIPSLRRRRRHGLARRA